MKYIRSRINCFGNALNSNFVQRLKIGSIIFPILFNVKINLAFFLEVYHNYASSTPFFLENNFFNKLAGNAELMQQIKAGLSEEEIRLSWQDDIKAFKQVRKKYLLYPDFE